MKQLLVLATAAVLSLSTAAALAQKTTMPAPATPMGAPAANIGVTTSDMTSVTGGWSAKHDLMGKQVVNDAKDKIGKVEDVILTPEGKASYAIVGVGGFVGIGRHDVAIPMDQLKFQDGKYVLAGGTKDALKALPKWSYVKK